MHLACLAVLLVLHCLPVEAETSTIPNPVVLKDKQPVRDLGGYVAYLLDSTQSLGIEDILRPETMARFRVSPDSEPSFGYRSDHIWLWIRLSNRSTLTEEWKLHLHNNFLHVIDVFVVHEDGRIVQPLSQRHDSPFDTRQLAYHQLVADLRIRGGSDADIYLRYRSGGHTGLRPTIESNSSFEMLATDKAAKAFLFQGILLLLMLAGLATAIAFRSFTPLAYALYLLSCALFVMQWDGYAFQYLWPGLPTFNANASLVIGCLLVVFSTTYVRSFLRSWREYPVIDKVLIANIVLAVLLLLAGAVMDTQPLKKAMVLVASASPVIFFVAAINAARRQFKQVRFFVIGWFGVILSAGLMSSRNLLNIDISRDLVVDSMRVVIVFDAVLMGLALLDRYAQERAAQRQVLQANLATSQRNLEMHSRLTRLEQRYDLARDLAERRGQQLADATHDLRQPLHALRLTVQGLVDKGTIDAPAAKAIERSFEYLEDLVESSLVLSSQDADSAATSAGSAVPTNGLAVEDLLRHVEDMFREDAETKGLSFVRVPCSAMTAADALPLMRIVANLVSNAVKYTERGRVLLGCRRREGKLSIEVHDTGPGLTAEEFEAAQRRAVRLNQGGDAVDGYGLGLDIVAGLSQRHGLRLRHSARPGRGTCIAVEVPLVAKAAA